MSWCDFLAGWVGGSAGLLVGHPADTVKVVQQAGVSTNIRNVVRTVWAREGSKGFFKGMLYPVLSNGCINSIFFGVYGMVLPKISTRDNPDYTAIFLAACAGGGAQLVVACPVELIKVRLQTQPVISSQNGRKYKGPWNCLTTVLREQGVRGLFRGIGPNAWRDGPGFGVYMVVYEWLLSHKSVRRDSPSAQFVSGGLAGVIAWLSVLPFDVVKSRLQTEEGGIYKGMMDCARQSYRQEGLGVFVRGAGAMSLRAFPVNGVTFLVYEGLLDQCNRFNR